MKESIGRLCLVCLIAMMTQFGCDDDEGSNCDDAKDTINLRWISEGANTGSSVFNILYFDQYNLVGSLFMYSGGYYQQMDFSWDITGKNCDTIEYDYTEYDSIINELADDRLVLEATDSSYYGQLTAYDRYGEGTSNTCKQPCTDNSQCGLGEACINLQGYGEVCWPSVCYACWDGGQDCGVSADGNCVFISCI